MEVNLVVRTDMASRPRPSPRPTPHIRKQTSRKCCMVPMCGNTSVSTPHKLFITIPTDTKRRQMWIAAARRDRPLSAKSNGHCCEDHFKLDEDMLNYTRYRMMGGNIILRKDVVPHIFACQPNRQSHKATPMPRTAYIKKKARALAKEVLPSDSDNNFNKPTASEAQAPIKVVLCHDETDAQGDQHEGVVDPLRLSTDDPADGGRPIHFIDIKCEPCWPDDPTEVSTGPEEPAASNDQELLSSAADEDFTIPNLISNKNSEDDNPTTNAKPHYCDVCQARFSRVSDLGRHVLKHTGEKPHSCTMCEARFTRKASLMRHTSMHTGEKPFVCDICEKRFSCKRILAKHARIHLVEKPYPCDMCDARFSCRTYLTSHQRKHTGYRPYVCEICQATFTRKDVLNRHERAHTGVKPHSCTMCDARFMDRWVLAAHMSIHSGEKPFSCDVCQARFSSNGSLANHKTTHTGRKPHACDVCDARFTRRGGLVNHKMSRHTEEKPFGCDVCQARFSLKGYLTAHLSTHSDERPYSCGVCRASFSHKCILNSHSRRHAQQKAYSCDICDTKFSCKKTLTRHSKKIHP